MERVHKYICTLISAFFLSLLLITFSYAAQVKGIYVTQWTLENTTYLHYLIKRAKSAGINTFVVDLVKPNRRYQENIRLVLDNKIKYVARIAMFPGGGTQDQVSNPKIWQSKYPLIQQAIALGASEIQLDYIRYNTKQKASVENAKRILKIIDWYKNKLTGQNIPLQIDVFGIASYGEAKNIGHNLKLFSQSVDAMCPMVYPSHYEPYKKHAITPYETVFDSLTHIQKQFSKNKTPFKLYPYIELSNYRYPMSHAKKVDYIKAQLRAVSEARAEGWYAWSPHNRYENLFGILENDTGVTPKNTTGVTPKNTPPL